MVVGVGVPATLHNHESRSWCCTTGHPGQTQRCSFLLWVVLPMEIQALEGMMLSFDRLPTEFLV